MKLITAIMRPEKLDELIDVVVDSGAHGLTVTLLAGASREAVAEVNRRIVAGGISVYSLQEVQATLEDWFLSVTTRLGEQS